MKIGIISDSHGRVQAVRQALGLLTDAGAEGIIHCGDLGGLEVLDELAGRPCWFVWGNMDRPNPAWRKHLEALELPWPTIPMEITLEGKRLAIFHGHEPEFAKAIKTASYDYLFHGHSHRREDYLRGKMRVINPGALQRVREKTVALLDLKNDRLEFVLIYDGTFQPSYARNA
ncbi:MAG: metallophosphoesterase family protein [Planctomycetota bacterium]|jgi:putative phosphoesterase